MVEFSVKSKSCHHLANAEEHQTTKGSVREYGLIQTTHHYL